MSTMADREREAAAAARSGNLYPQRPSAGQAGMLNLSKILPDLTVIDGRVIYGGNAMEADPTPRVFDWSTNSLVTETEFFNKIVSSSNAERAALAKRINAIQGFRVSPDRASGSLESAALDIARNNTIQNVAMFQRSQTDPGYQYTPLTFEQSLQSGSGGGAGGVSRQVSYASFNEAESTALLEGFYLEALGRRPNDKEIRAFNKRINEAASKKPTVSTQTMSGTTQTSRSVSGFGEADAQLMAREQAESTRGASGYLMSTKYYDAFIRAIESRV